MKLPPVSPIHEALPRHSRPVLIVGLVGGFLCLTAGYLNAVSLLLLNRTTTHTTGLMTKTSAALAQGELALFLEHFAQLAGFVVGATVSSVMVGAHKKFKGGNHHTRVLSCIAVLVALAAFVSQDTVFLAGVLISFAAGMQNAMTTYYSGAIVRTTHVTGTLTDMGTEMAQLLLGRNKHPWKLQVLGCFTLGFFLGGCLGAVVAAACAPGPALCGAAVAYALMALGNALFHAGHLRGCCARLTGDDDWGNGTWAGAGQSGARTGAVAPLPAAVAALEEDRRGSGCGEEKDDGSQAACTPPERSSQTTEAAQAAEKGHWGLDGSTHGEQPASMRTTTVRSAENEGDMSPIDVEVVGTG